MGEKRERKETTSRGIWIVLHFKLTVVKKGGNSSLSEVSVFLFFKIQFVCSLFVTPS